MSYFIFWKSWFINLKFIEARKFCCVEKVVKKILNIFDGTLIILHSLEFRNQVLNRIIVLNH
jgi:hypothetical protein